MRVALYGATERAGSRIMRELWSRGHPLTHDECLLCQAPFRRQISHCPKSPLSEP